VEHWCTRDGFTSGGVGCVSLVLAKGVEMGDVCVPRSLSNLFFDLRML
jgi:hypothetical protein